MAAAAAVSCAKRNLRAELKQRLRAISAEERLRQSRLLTQKVIAHSQYQKCKRISIFLSMPDEIETEEIIKDIFQRGKTCFIPRYQSQSNHMDMVKLASPEEISSLPRTSWNIHQPGEDEDREEALSTGGLDLIFMPGLGFDKQGNRLGRGRGYYDAYLARCVQTQRSKPYTVALAFSQQICPQVPTDESDVKFKLNIYEKLCSDSVWKEGEVVGRRHGVTKSCHGPGQSRAEIMGGSVSVAPLRVHRPFPCCLLHSPRLIGKSSATAVPSPGPTTAPAPRTRNLPDV